MVVVVIECYLYVYADKESPAWKGWQARQPCIDLGMKN
jgi:hypothetical protein